MCRLTGSQDGARQRPNAWLDLGRHVPGGLVSRDIYWVQRRARVHWRVDDNAHDPTIPYQFAVFHDRHDNEMMGPLWTEAEALIVAEALTRARAEGRLD